MRLRLPRWFPAALASLWGMGCSGDGPPPARRDPAEAKTAPPAPADTYRCSHCGREHPGPILAYRIPAPVYYDAIPEADRARRVRLDGERCTIDGEHHFVAANLELPIQGSEEKLTFTVWVSLSPANFERANELWTTPGRESEPPYFGWLSSQLPGFPDTVNLKTRVHTRPVGQRPWVELEPTDHPLAVAQREGITRDRVREFAEMAEHPEPEDGAKSEGTK